MSERTRVPDSERLTKMHDELVAAWHIADPGEIPGAADFMELVVQQHLRNYRLWHTEDEARRRDVSDSVIAECKRTIDRFNQQRQDFIERLDEAIIAAWPWIAEESDRPMNSETLGSAIDRLSIGSLKIFHMNEQLERTDVDESHLVNCRGKVAVLRRQRADLAAAFDRLADDLYSRNLRTRVYRQFKMYNDPSLNPALYRGGAKKS